MFDQKSYKGPYKVVVRVDGSDRDQVGGTGLSAEDAEALAETWAGKPHVALVTVQDEPTSHTVAIVYDRGAAEEQRGNVQEFDRSA